MAQLQATDRFQRATRDLEKLRSCFSAETGEPKWWSVFWCDPDDWFRFVFKSDGADRMFERIVSKAADIITDEMRDSTARLSQLKTDLEMLKAQTISTMTQHKVQETVHGRLAAEAEAISNATNPKQFARGGA